MSDKLNASSFLFGANAVFIEELYQQYLNSPESVDESWRQFFQGQNDITPLKTSSSIITPQGQRAECKSTSNHVSAINASTASHNLPLLAKLMIQTYRTKAHYLAELDPLNMEIKKSRQDLKLDNNSLGLDDSILSETVDLSEEYQHLGQMTIAELQQFLECSYANNIGVEFAHIEDMQEQQWLYQQIEESNRPDFFTDAQRKDFLHQLVRVEMFEHFLHTKFPGAKRFSAEGGENAVLALDVAINKSAQLGVEEVVLGLAHRGRLSTLTTIMRKPYRALFSEFMGGMSFPEHLGVAGDVKYHMGYSSDRITNGCKIHLSLTPNPSHLEAVNPVVAGKVRAKQDLAGRNRQKVMGLLVHGDAAFCGQGIVAESLVMSTLKSYDVGGILHVVINNQVGFTAGPKDGRPGRYCTDIAKSVGAPILHINGDDAESVARATYIACAYRNKFGKDIVLDIVCYRKYGHNEGDEPNYTQPLMYNIIKEKKTPAAIYAKRLEDANIISDIDYNLLRDECKKILDEEFSHASNYQPEIQCFEGLWKGFTRNGKNGYGTNGAVATGVKKSLLLQLGARLYNIPADFAIHPKLHKLLEVRKQELESGKPLDWAAAEQLAFASLLEAGTPVRITGQDAGRGTFSHRHAVLHSQADDGIYEPLNNLSNKQAFFEVHDSNLSEYGVLGFEYGYSMVNPQHLVIWEAQFGDFANGAQIIFDQFLSSTETKWLRMSGLVCLLPHAMEGQGPEHSSARLERFLQLCGDNNMQVAYPTTPASIFHLLRRQILQDVRKPLIIMSPKSLLRHKLAVSDLALFDEGTKFQPVLGEIDADITASDVNKVIICSGKVYYDLLEKRRELAKKNIAIIRLEQLYPFPGQELQKELAKYPNTKEIIWCQEEPQNMGAWQFTQSHIDELLQAMKIHARCKFVGRPIAASPAVGYLSVHNKEQQKLLIDAL